MSRPKRKSKFRMFEVDRIAPRFRHEAIELHNKGYAPSQIIDVFREQYGERQVSMANFYRWLHAVLLEQKELARNARLSDRILRNARKACRHMTDEDLFRETMKKMRSLRRILRGVK